MLANRKTRPVFGATPNTPTIEYLGRFVLQIGHPKTLGRPSYQPAATVNIGT
jgi:hypothetical protein